MDHVNPWLHNFYHFIVCFICSLVYLTFTNTKTNLFDILFAEQNQLKYFRFKGWLHKQNKVNTLLIISF